MALFEDMDLVGSKSYGKYLAPGINAGVTIGPITYNTDGPTPYINVTLYRSNSTAEEGGKDFRLYMSEAARKRSIEKLTHLATKVITKEKLLEINNSSNTIETFISSLSALLVGSTINYLKLCAEEYLNSNNEVRRRLSLGLPPFASMANSEAESKLKYSETNPYDYKPLTVTQGINNSLPF
jgi:hypothetical protein